MCLGYGWFGRSSRRRARYSSAAAKVEHHSMSTSAAARRTRDAQDQRFLMLFWVLGMSTSFLFSYGSLVAFPLRWAVCASYRLRACVMASKSAVSLASALARRCGRRDRSSGINPRLMLCLLDASIDETDQRLLMAIAAVFTVPIFESLWTCCLARYPRIFSCPHGHSVLLLLLLPKSSMVVWDTACSEG